MFESVTIPGKKVNYEQPVGLFINNEYVSSSDKKTYESYNPSTGDKIVTFQAASESDTERAIDAADEAFDKVWSKTSAKERAALLKKLGKLTEDNQELLGYIESLDTGKPYESNASVDIQQCIDAMEYAAGAAQLLTGGTTIPSAMSKHLYTEKHPFGVVAIIVPWNYPLTMAAWKMFNCLAAGNTVVIKPSEETSLSLLYFTKLVKEAGFPPGVVNVVPGLGNVVGNALASSQKVHKISFTGSTAVGKSVMELAAKSNLKDVLLECGGKSPALIFEDANMELAATSMASGICFNTGQNCIATSRLFIQESEYDKFIPKLVEAIKATYKFSGNGDPFDSSNTLGPVITSSQYKKIKELVRIGNEEEKLEAIQVYKSDEIPSKGQFVSPVIFVDVPNDSKVMKEEIFGPVLVVSKFKDYDDAIRKANNTAYGLAAGIFTEDMRTARKFVKDIQAGTVWVNTAVEEDIIIPFGGFRMSGIGRELGHDGIQSYLQTKSIHVNLEI